MTSRLEAGIRKNTWEASKRAQRSGLIGPGLAEKALKHHIAGRYDDAVAIISSISPRERSAAAWRVLGHAELGRGNFQNAIAAHLSSAELNRASDAAVADDQVNIASVYIAMERYEEAWEAAELAKRLAPPGSMMPWTPRISILNRQGKRAELYRELADLLAERPDVLEDAVFRDHIDNDFDFIGVKEIVAEIKGQQKAGSTT
jgi:tetratricopeptide (TPR) repeat protein